MSATENIDLSPWMMGCVYWEGYGTIETQVSEYINEETWRYAVNALPDEDLANSRMPTVRRIQAHVARMNLNAFIEPWIQCEFDDEDPPLRFSVLRF